MKIEVSSHSVPIDAALAAADASLVTADTGQMMNCLLTLDRAASRVHLKMFLTEEGCMSYTKVCFFVQWCCTVSCNNISFMKDLIGA